MGLAVGTEKGIAKNLSNMAHNMFKKDITWFKVASFYNLVSGAAVDCVRQVSWAGGGWRLETPAAGPP